MSRGKNTVIGALLGLWLVTAGATSFCVGFGTAVGATRTAAHASGATPAAPPRPLAHRAPTLSSRALPSRQVAARPQVPAPRGRLAVVIDDCGNSYAANAGFLQLGRPITLAVLPHLPATLKVAQEARERGLCVILHLPMEARDGRNPGPGTLRVAMSDSELTQTLLADFEEVPGIVGVNNHEGSRASADPRVMAAVLDEVAHRGLFYLDSRTTERTLAPSLAPARGLTCLSRQVFLDNQDDPAAVLAQLREAARRARQSGQAIAIGHPRANTLQALRSFTSQSDHQDVELVPLSELATNPGSRPGRSHS